MMCFKKKINKYCSFLLIAFFILSSNGYSQTKKINPIYASVKSETWHKLFSISFKKVKDGKYGELEKPVFSQDAKSLEGKEIILEGYIFPTADILDGGNKVLLTALPVNNCFFCGTGGPESVATVKFKKNIDYTDRMIKVKGKLLLNDSDPDELVYILENAEFIGKI